MAKQQISTVSHQPAFRHRSRSRLLPSKVELNDKMYIADRTLGQALHAMQLEQKQRVCVQVRVIPLCPMTAKIVLANSTQNNGDSVRIRGKVEDSDEWPLDRIAAHQ